MAKRAPAPAAQNFDVVIVGSGAAGLTAALNLADRARVVVLSKGALSAGSTAWAQGGIAAVLERGDTFESHIDDTMVAGAGLNDRRAVEFVVENAPAAIARLTDCSSRLSAKSGRRTSSRTATKPLNSSLPVPVHSRWSSMKRVCDHR